MPESVCFVDDENRLAYPGWRIVLASAACVFVSFGSLLIYTFGVFLKPVAAEFHWSREAVSGAFGLAALSVAVCSPFIGMLLDRVPARRIILPCLLVFGCAFASLGLLTDHLGQLYGTFVLLGIVGNGTAHLAYSRALSTWFNQRRGAAFATLLSGGALGAMVLPPLAQWLIGIAGWRVAFGVLGALVLAIGLPAGTRVREHSAGRTTTGAGDQGTTVKDATRSWIFWVILTVLFFASLSQNGAIAHLAALMTDRGIPAGSAALAVSALGAATLGGRLLTGWLLDRFFAPRVAFGLLSVAATGTLVLSAAHSSGVGIVGAVLIGLGMGGEADVTPYLLSRYFGLRSFSTLYGLSWTAYAIAGALGPILMGRAFDATGSYGTLLARLAVWTFFTAALTLLLPRFHDGRKTDDENPLAQLARIAAAE